MFVEVPVQGMGGNPRPEVIAVAHIVRWRPVSNHGETIVHLSGGAGSGERLRVRLSPERFEALIVRANEGRAVLRPAGPESDVRQADRLEDFPEPVPHEERVAQARREAGFG